ncbi:MAG: 30S ribosome-binding factor RbfA [bacterium]|nr:30S ribosome-binding factor RbfA [bacterium]
MVNWRIGQLVDWQIGQLVDWQIGQLADWRIINMSSSKRSEQLEKYLKIEINKVIYREINDPRIKFVTITKIQVSSDLKYAKIFVSIFNDNDEGRQKLALEGLEHATKFIRGEIGKDLKLRFIPEITFKIDKDIEYQYKLQKIISEIHKKQSDTKKDKNNE